MKIFSITAWALFTFVGTFLVLSVFGLVPTEIKELNATVMSFFSGVSPETLSVGPAGSISTPSQVIDNEDVFGTALITDPEDPVRVVIAKVGINAPVGNPQTTDPKILDAGLLAGAVHYPGSGSLGENKNVFIFGHSTSLPVVHNQSFKTFNRLGELQLGDEIDVYSSTKVYRYRIVSISLAKASEALVSFEAGERKLTLSTCDTFGEKSDRFVVEAVFEESSPLAAQP